MRLDLEILAENKSLLAKLSVMESDLNRYKEMCARAWAKNNQLTAEYSIAKEALENIADHSFIPPASFVDVASDALYRIGQMEAEKK